MPINAPTELILYPAAASSGDDTTATGGAVGTPAVTGGSPGEIFPRLRANPAGGALDGTGAADTQVQYQKAFFANLSTTSDLLLSRIFLKNGLIRPAAASSIYVVIAHINDAGKQLRCWNALSSAIAYEAINTPSAIGAASATVGATSPSWMERTQIVNATSGAQVTAYNDIQIWAGNPSGAGTLLGIIPAGYSWATGEMQMLGIASIDDTSTVANRRTAPSGTFSRAYTYATGIVIRLDVANDTIARSTGTPHAQGYWGKMTLQCGMPPTDALQFVWRIQGDST